jgi:type VI secretion system protein ImpE
VSTAEDSVRAGHLAEALSRLQTAVRQRPADSKLRVFLAQLLMVMGQWDRALVQLKVLGEMDAAALPMIYECRGAISAERMRKAVFAGAESPLLFGEPQPWVALLVQALLDDAGGRHASAVSLRTDAFQAAAETPGLAGEQRIAWIADADPRLGPVLEVILEGRYFWVPFERIQKVTISAPKDLQDLVWAQAQFTWTNGGDAVGLIPSRYPGTEDAADDGLRLCRKTEWVGADSEQVAGLGQRLLATDVDDFALLDLRELVFDPPA